VTTNSSSLNNPITGQNLYTFSSPYGGALWEVAIGLNINEYFGSRKATIWAKTP
jgi:hypothetical protein